MSEFEILSLQQENRNFWLALIVAIITLISVVLIYIDYKNRKNKEKAEKSIEIAKSFALDIINPLSVLWAFFSKFNITILIEKVNFMYLEDFDIDELLELYKQDSIDEYKQILSQNDPEGKIRTIICDTLNSLEYLCMYISTKVADEKYIYNSLHQQFLKSIALLYFEISLINVDNKDKYYTNIIHVYNLWKNKYIKSMRKENRIKKKQKKLKQKITPQNPKI